LIPVYGFLEGDTIGLLILASEQDTAVSLIEKLQTAARSRVAPRTGLRVRFAGRTLRPGETVQVARMHPLDRFDVVVADA
jgi:hypothetical protein